MEDDKPTIIKLAEGSGVTTCPHDDEQFLELMWIGRVKEGLTPAGSIGIIVSANERLAAEEKRKPGFKEAVCLALRKAADEIESMRFQPSAESVDVPKGTFLMPPSSIVNGMN